MNDLNPHDAPAHDAAAPATLAPERAPTAGRARGLLYAVLLVILAADQFTKYLIEANLEMFDSWVPFPAVGDYFRFYHTYNTGASFGLFPNGGLFFAVMAVVVSLAIFYYNHTLAGGQRLLRLALGLQAGGALGNFVDRVRLGHVTDFLDFNLQPLINVPLADWPVFNVADMAIVGGVIMLAGIMLREEARLRAAHESQAHDPLTPTTTGSHVDKRSTS
jgi:signal peptidase II